MSFLLECKKAKRTGLLPAFFCGGILAAAFPIINMAVRAEMFVNQKGSPVRILLDANWQMMAMLHVLFVVAGACLFYHIEYADNAMQKMNTLPIRESSVFFGKVILLCLLSMIVFILEAASVVFCSAHWFGIGTDFWPELCKNFGYSFVLSLPCILLSLLLSSACKNMWVSLGIGVVCVFTATILPQDHFVLTLFPFAMPFQTLEDAGLVQVIRYTNAAFLEVVGITLAELLFIKIRREFE